MKMIRFEVLDSIKVNASTYTEIFDFCKSQLLTQNFIQCGSPYELSMYNNFVLASNNNIHSPFNLGFEIKLEGKYIDIETLLIGNNPIEELWDLIMSQYENLAYTSI